MTATGWRISEIDDLTFDDVTPLLDYWKKWPPMHVILKCVYAKPETKVPKELMPPEPKSQAEEPPPLSFVQQLPGVRVKQKSNG